MTYCTMAWRALEASMLFVFKITKDLEPQIKQTWFLVSKVATLKLLSLIWQKLSTQNFLRNSSWNVPDTQWNGWKRQKQSRLSTDFCHSVRIITLYVRWINSIILLQSHVVQWSVFFSKNMYNRQYYLAPICQIIWREKLTRS